MIRHPLKNLKVRWRNFRDKVERKEKEKTLFLDAINAIISKNKAGD